VIPQLFCTGFFQNIPALFLSEIAGTTLHDIAHDDKCNLEEGILQGLLENALGALSKYNATYWDPKLDNFLFCKNGRHGKVMIVDLEQVTFSSENQPWEQNINMGNVSCLMNDFRNARNPNRPPSPIDWKSVYSAQPRIMS